MQASTAASPSMSSPPKFDADEIVCPLCCEELDLSDKNFLPCPCGYQVCMWCWHHIKDELNGLCPACRSPYSNNPHIFAAVDRSEVIKSEKRRKRAAAAAASAAAPRSVNQVSSHNHQTQQANHHQQVYQQQKGAAIPSDVTASHTLEGGASSAVSPGYQQHPRSPFESIARKDLVHLRVIQRNLVYVTGLHVTAASEGLLRKPEYFGQYGRILKLVANTVNNNTSASGQRAVSASVYVTFQHAEDACACIRACDGFILEGRHIKANYGTTKYCNSFLNNKACNNHDCLYLHSLGNPYDCFNKDDIQTKNLLATPLSPRTLTHSGGGGPSGTGKRCANPILPAPTYVAKGTTSASRGGTQPLMASPLMKSMPSAAAAHSDGSGNSVAIHNTGSSTGGIAQPHRNRAFPNSATTPWVRGATKSPVASSGDPYDKNVSHTTTSNMAWPSLGEAVSTLVGGGGWGGTSSSPIVAPAPVASSMVRKVKGKGNNNSKSEAAAAGKEYQQRPGATENGGGMYLQGQGRAAEQQSQSRAEVQAQAHAQMLARQQAHMRAQAEMRLQSADSAAAIPGGSGGSSSNAGRLTPGKRTKTRTAERQNIKPAANVVTTPSSEGVRPPGSAVVSAASSLDDFQSYCTHSTDHPLNQNQMVSLEKSNHLSYPPGLGQGEAGAAATSPFLKGSTANGGNRMFSKSLFFSERDANSEMSTRTGDGGSTNVNGMRPASHHSNYSVAVSSAPTPNGSGGGDTEAKDDNLIDAMENSSSGNPSSRRNSGGVGYPPRSCSRVLSSGSSPGEKRSRSFGRAFSSALFPASTLVGFNDGKNTPGSDLTVDPYSKNGTSALAALLGVTLPPVDSQCSLAAASYRLPLEQLQQNHAMGPSLPQLYSGMHR